ncbi:glycosyl transferase [Granulicella sp. WH15]|uniref:glucoamylase family protein n=1 Tax=Granulicella sp. WH15 TaxID=2602070 RepID=UPI001366BFB4|nr:glucoamylase family protein [Granulicella sp. WH15]QHN03951.1 glycosyl transferase [Granulicella sp. WH15]
MDQLPPDELPNSPPETPDVSDVELCRHAAASVDTWEMAPPSHKSAGLPQRLEKLTERLEAVLHEARSRVSGKELTPQLELLQGARLFNVVLTEARGDIKSLYDLPHIHIPHQGVFPRVANLAQCYLAATHGIWSPESLSVYLKQAQKRHPLLLKEVMELEQVLKFAQLEYIVDRAEEVFAAGPTPPYDQSPFSAPIYSLRRLNQYEWNPLLESAVSFEPILCDDPSGTFLQLEEDTRTAYLKRVADLASYADYNEVETASAAIQMARHAATVGAPDPRQAQRMQHVGYYLFAEGLPALQRRIGYHAPPAERLRSLIRRYNDDFYIISIVTLSIVLTTPVIAPLVPHNNFWFVMGVLLLALLPITQGAVELINGIVSSILKAEALPKLDYTKGVPVEATTLVVIPTLLLHEKQVQELFEDLEARYLANEDPNIHFALLTDLPDTPIEPSADENHPLVQLAIRQTDGLNAKYATGHAGSFLLLHRRRLFNSRQGVWMGWERKRGKLLDLNKLLLHTVDNFPIKSGPLHVLEQVRYVITLDSDTQLPRSTAARMIGTICHPLNRAIISPRLRIVTAGYGILQPRVGVSVASASRSRLASIYSGETGFDIYSRTVSDVYQDLFGEGIFAGKGIYEVTVLHQVLERRFPRNSLLSHDLIEGAYVRAGLVTDIEIIDDYPSQYHAHTRRKHRWIRGDWQIMRWLLARVPDESGRLVPNPISAISQWKILDNLRRSLVEPVTFLVLVFGWFFFPGGAHYWTIVIVTLAMLPSLVQLGLDLIKALLATSWVATRGAFTNFSGSIAFAVLNLTFLPHQMMLSLDAIVRSLVRSLLSGRHLLEWETAAQAEANVKRTSLDVYLQASPIIAVLMGFALAHFHPMALFSAGPILFLWLIAPFAAAWLNSPPHEAQPLISTSNRTFLQQQALRIWRFYADFAGANNFWLTPDNIEEKSFHQVRLLTPTNVGMMLNSRQAAHEFGFITIPEFTEATLGSLTTYGRLQKHNGHLFNWYDLVDLKPLEPVVVSTVDSGNLAASLYTLYTGALDILKRPLLTLETLRVLNRIIPDAPPFVAKGTTLASAIRQLFNTPTNPVVTTPGTTHDTWAIDEVVRRRAALRSLISNYLPWLLPEFEPLVQLVPMLKDPAPSAERAQTYIRSLSEALAPIPATSPHYPLARSLSDLLPQTLERAEKLHRDLKSVSDLAEQYAEDMDFGFLFVEKRQLLSNGFDMKGLSLHAPCFDLLASEARTAAFLAVAKNDIPQRSWFRLDRVHTLVNGRVALLSWTATMFEYMMPTLFMRSYPGTLLSNSLKNVIRTQIDFAHSTLRGMPWGISESGFAQQDENGRYAYLAFGIPSLALKYPADFGPVISPYSTFLALPHMRKQALQNLHRMAELGWVGEYGFYEAADYMEIATGNKEPRPVRSWMAHHQGMSMLAITNTLHHNIFQTWFHANPRVRAAEQLLHERPLNRDVLNQVTKPSLNQEVEATR